MTISIFNCFVNYVEHNFLWILVEKYDHDHHYRRPLKNLLLMRFFIRCWTEGADFFFFRFKGGPGSPEEIKPGYIPEIKNIHIISVFKSFRD